MKLNCKKILALGLALIMVLALAACSGGGGSAGGGKVTGIFLSPGNLDYKNMRPTYNYYMTTFTHEEITLMDDNTYCLIISSSMFTALELDENTQDAKGNERDNYITKLYGTYTSTVNEFDDKLLDVTLSNPTRVVKSVDQTYWLDTDSWTEDMGERVIPPTGYDDMGTAIYDPDAKPLTAQEYLATFSLSTTNVQLNTKTASFDFTDFGVN